MPEDSAAPAVNEQETTVKSEALAAFLNGNKVNKKDALAIALTELASDLVKEQVAKFKPVLLAGYREFQKQSSDIRKLEEKPDVPAVKSLTGEVVVPAGFSEATLKKIREAKEAFTKLTKALIKALEQADIGDLQNLTKGGGKPESPSGS